MRLAAHRRAALLLQPVVVDLGTRARPLLRRRKSTPLETPQGATSFSATSGCVCVGSGRRGVGRHFARPECTDGRARTAPGAAGHCCFSGTLQTHSSGTWCHNSRRGTPTLPRVPKVMLVASGLGNEIRGLDLDTAVLPIPVLSTNPPLSFNRDLHDLRGKSGVLPPASEALSTQDTKEPMGARRRGVERKE
jgi:hypothetical protein